MKSGTDSIAYQKEMAAKLRGIVFLYLQGKLRDKNGRLVDDGPAVIALRKNLSIVGGMDTFITSQSPNGAWATNLELELLADLLDTNIVCETMATRQKKQVVQPRNANASIDMPTIRVVNTDSNTHWNAVVGDQVISAIGDGNCAYNSAALAIKDIAKLYGIKPIPVSSTVRVEAPVMKTETVVDQVTKQIRMQNLRYQSGIEAAQRSRNAQHQMMEDLKLNDPSEYEKLSKQIEEDHQLALKMALMDLPGIEGKPSQHYFSIPTGKECDHEVYYRNLADKVRDSQTYCKSILAQ